MPGNAVYQIKLIRMQHRDFVYDQHFRLFIVFAQALVALHGLEVSRAQCIAYTEPTPRVDGSAMQMGCSDTGRRGNCNAYTVTAQVTNILIQQVSFSRTRRPGKKDIPAKFQ